MSAAEGRHKALERKKDDDGEESRKERFGAFIFLQDIQETVRRCYE